MPVTDVTKDLDACTLTITAHFAAPVERVWQVYADRRQLEQVWGPPTHPATFGEHRLEPGARSTYWMTGPEGEKYCGVWEINGVDAPHRFTFADYFADEDFNVKADLPVSQNVYTFTPDDGGTTAVYTSIFDSPAALQQILEMGTEEGATSAINQIDSFLSRG